MEGCVFFFFFPAESPEYKDPLFRHFCEACAAARRAYPHVTVSACRTLLSVACGDEGEGLTYERVAQLAGLDYMQAAHHIELLSSGRRDKEGLQLLSRAKVGGGKVRCVRLTPKGEEFVRLFAPSQGAHPDFSRVTAELAKGPLPALRVAAEMLPKITLGSFTVLLHIGLKQREFGFDGLAAKVVADELGVSNLPRHVATLGRGKRGQEGYGLIDLIESPKDGRIKLPELTDEGHRVMHAVACAVLGREIDPPRKVKPEAFEQQDRPEDVRRIMDEEDPDKWGEIVWGNDGG